MSRDTPKVNPRDAIPVCALRLVEQSAAVEAVMDCHFNKQSDERDRLIAVRDTLNTMLGLNFDVMLDLAEMPELEWLRDSSAPDMERAVRCVEMAHSFAQRGTPEQAFYGQAAEVLRGWESLCKECERIRELRSLDRERDRDARER